uniref:Lysosome-associated membrane glycoprotein 2-like luminal domain-containing protein n=1 Tax=Mola mola TaxID=94237 RepID=A0A3Q3W0M5_MOLML
PELQTEVQIYQPVLQPSESLPITGTYMLNKPDGTPCIKATVGVEYIVIEKKTWYFNLDPARVRTSGYCNKQAAVLSLTLPDNAASLQLTFRKVRHIFYNQTFMSFAVEACSNKTYAGLVSNKKLFKTASGESFKCKSDYLLPMSSVLQIKLVPLQLQAFSLHKGQYGKEVECWADFKKRVFPIIIGAVLVCLILIALLTYLFIKDRRRQGYDTL